MGVGVKAVILIGTPAGGVRGQARLHNTAWALLGLIAAGGQTSLAIEKGISYLLKTQQKDGSWSEAAYTGTGFPGAFYLRYDLYRIYFPLLALARYRNNFRRGV